MFRKVTTLTEFIITEERRFQTATGNFSLLLTQIENAAKIIASHIKKTGLVDILGHTGETNASDEQIQKLDQYSNDLLVDILSKCGQTYAIASEELEDPFFITDHPGNYAVLFDPLDGSSNIDCHASIGSIFSIYRKNSSLLQPGHKQIAAGYILYGSSVMFVYSCGYGVNGFTLDPSIGSFLLSHPNITIPQSASIYTINEGYSELFFDKEKQYLLSIKKGEKPYKLRYIGTMVADIHRILIKGGIFLYPKDIKHPDGKLRLMFEVNPLSYLVNQAGGLSISNGKNPLEIVPKTLHEKIPVVMGSKKEVEKYMQIK